MRERILRHRVGVATIVAALGVAALTLYATTGPPLGDCFGGVLSKDPLHCYALEQADEQGIIDVETVYDVGGTLYFSLRQNDPVGSHVYEFLKTKSYEFYDRWPDDVPVNPKYDWWCTLARGLTYRQCYLEKTGWRPSFMLPESMVYTNVLFHTGGEAARRLKPGWAAWRQVWPAMASGASGAADASTASVAFDVSDVDMTNLPVITCSYGRHDTCGRDQEVALSVVGVNWGGGKMYVQTVNPPEDEAGIHRFRKAMDPCYDITGRCVYTATTTVARIVNGVETQVARSTQVTIYNEGPPPPADSIVIVPVKYGPGELVRWTEVLDRFATSTGNTIGITGARLQDNSVSYHGHTVFRTSPAGLVSLSPAISGAYGLDWTTVRDTIVVLGFDAQRIADALPTLLPLLGIPVDAVGVVVTDSRNIIWRMVPGGVDRRSFPDVPAEHTGNELRHDGPLLERLEWTVVSLRVPLLLARNVGVVLVVGGVVALGLRLRRRLAPG